MHSRCKALVTETTAAALTVKWITKEIDTKRINGEQSKQSARRTITVYHLYGRNDFAPSAERWKDEIKYNNNNLSDTHSRTHAHIGFFVRRKNMTDDCCGRAVAAHSMWFANAKTITINWRGTHKRASIGMNWNEWQTAKYAINRAAHWCDVILIIGNLWQTIIWWIHADDCCYGNHKMPHK